MNSKLIAIIAVVAMCGAALVGVGYAYTSTYTDSGSGDVGAEYVDITGGWSPVINDSIFKYDTTKTGTADSVKTLTLTSGSYDGWSVSESSGSIVATLALGSVTFEPKADASITLDQIKVKIGSEEYKGLTAITGSSSTTEFTSATNAGITGNNTTIIVVAQKDSNNISLTFSVQITLGTGSISGDTVTMNIINNLEETWGAISAQYEKA